MSYVFISHASPDKPRVKPVVEALLKAGLKIWIDNPAAAGFTANEIDQFDRIRAGNRWEDEIDKAKKEAACILVCWSKHAITGGVLSGNERITWLGEADYARTEQKLVACTVDDVSPTALPGTHPAQQLPCLDPDILPERWSAVMATVVSDIKRKIELHLGKGQAETTKAVEVYVEGLRSFCAKSTYNLGDRLSSDAEKLFVDIEGGLTTIEDLSVQAQGDTSGKPHAATLARELLAESINKNGAAVLCGGAGTGKSTLLRRFALLAWEAPAKVGLTRQSLPILVRLRHLASAQGGTFGQKIKHALKAANDFTTDRTIPNDFLTSWPEATQAALLFLFDGLDEVSANERERLLTFLEQLRSRFPDVPMVLSTRDSELVRNTMFSSPETAACIAVHQLSPATAINIARALLSEAELQRFMQERDRGRSFAFDTALGVRMAAAIIIKRDQKLPDTRGKLYERLIHQSFGDRAEDAVQIPEVLVNEGGALHVLGAVAAMNLDPVIPSAPDIETCVADALQELLHDRPAVLARGNATDVLSWMRRRGGVLASLDPLAWSHETCREFLAAHWIEKRFKPDDPAMLDLTRRACNEPRLRSVMLFAFSIWTSSSLYEQEGDRSKLAEKVYASFEELVAPPRKPSLIARLMGRESDRPEDPTRLATRAPATLFLAEIFAEIRPGPTTAVNSVIGQLSDMHRDFVGYFDEPKSRCAGDENVVRCLRRWADHPPLRQALQPIADRYMDLFDQFGLAKSEVVNFLLLAGRRNAIEPIVTSGALTTIYDVLESIRGAVAAEGPNGATALALARSAINGTHPSVKPIDLPTGTRFVWGRKDAFDDERTWIAPQEFSGGLASDYYATVSEAAATLHDAGFIDEVVAKIAADEVSIDLYSTCVGHKKMRNDLADRCARDASLPAPKRAFAICVLVEEGALGELAPDDAVPVLTAAEQDPAHVKWAAPIKSTYCQKRGRFEDMRDSCDLLAQAEPDNGAAWFDLGWSSYRLGRHEAALSAFEKAGSLGYKPAQTHYFRGCALLDLEHYAEAVVAFNDAALSGNDELRMWERRLEAKYLVSWYAAVQEDTEFLCTSGHQDLPFVRHWQAVVHCLAGRHAEALEVFTLLDAEPYWPGQVPFFRAVALIGTGAYDQADSLIEQTEYLADDWKAVLRAMLAAAKDLPPPACVVEMRDRIMSADATATGLEPAFWLCAALDDADGARRCVQAIESQGDARTLSKMMADLATVVASLARPWCRNILEEGMR